MFTKPRPNNDWPLVLSFTLIVILCAREYKLIALLPMVAWILRNRDSCKR